VDEDSNSDHLSSSLTDLMTSLMVIFILLLLVFISSSAAKDAVLTDVLLAKLKHDLHPQGLNPQSIRPDPKDRNAILVIVPGKLMNFDVQKSDLKPEGRQFLWNYIPAMAQVLYSPEFRDNIESVVVEGHTDSQKWGNTQDESQANNLRLSQDRSMTVVKEALASLHGSPAYRSYFLEKLSATGRGEQDPERTDSESRRVIFRIRVKARSQDQLQTRISQ
jgi:outer membrane protein OmpA-like peptidoglycan-associated protein